MLSVCNWYEGLVLFEPAKFLGDCLGPFAIILIKYASDKFEIIAIRANSGHQKDDGSHSQPEY
uniref:Uncharacterized protein n=1 Tax=Oryza rufipogon TaxID=4529 RepID=A0A0E0PZE8_ORYRU